MHSSSPQAPELLFSALVAKGPCRLLSSHLPAQATHADFANRLYAAPDVVKSPRFAKPKLDPTGFTIQHYAGGVQVMLMAASEHKWADAGLLGKAACDLLQHSIVYGELARGVRGLCSAHSVTRVYYIRR